MTDHYDRCIQSTYSAMRLAESAHTYMLNLCLNEEQKSEVYREESTVSHKIIEPFGISVCVGMTFQKLFIET